MRQEKESRIHTVERDPFENDLYRSPKRSISERSEKLLGRPLLEWVPALDQVLSDCGFELDGTTLVFGARRCRLHWDGINMVRKWVTEGWHRELMAREKRPTGIYRRADPGPDEAIGLRDLPQPELEGRMLVLDAHVARLAAATCDWSDMGAGIGCWHYIPYSEDALPLRCWCGKVRPSQSHVMWNCPRVAVPRGLLPRDMAEERLLVRGIRLPPVTRSPPVELVSTELRRALAARFRLARVSGDFIYIATDGSHFGDQVYGAGGWAAVIKAGCSLLPFGGQMHGDVSAFAAELTALWQVASAADAECPSCKFRDLRFVILCDCMSAIDTVSKARVIERAALVRETQLALERLRVRGVEVVIHWLPSHKREVEGWLPPLGLSKEECIRMNDVADDHAKRHGVPSLAMQQWLKSREAALGWSIRVLAHATFCLNACRNWFING